jgi:hypothetical protein
MPIDSGADKLRLPLSDEDLARARLISHRGRPTPGLQRVSGIERSISQTLLFFKLGDLGFPIIERIAHNYLHSCEPTDLTDEKS